MTRDRLDRAEAAVESACAEVTAVVSLCQAVHAAVAEVVPPTGGAASPSTPRRCSRRTVTTTRASTSPHSPACVELEHRVPDVNNLPALARTPSGVSTLSAATDGDLAASARWRDVLAPTGLAHELRAVFRSSGNVWGALVARVRTR